MADRVITAEAVINGRDNTGDMFARLGAKVEGFAKKAKASVEIERMNTALEKSKSQLAALEKLQAARAKVIDARGHFNAQKAAVEKAAKAVSDAAKPTAEMNQALARQQAAVRRANAEFEKPRDLMVKAKRAAEEFGAPISKIASEQARLRASIESTTQAIQHQSAAEHKAAEEARRNAVAQAKVEREQEKRAHGIKHHGIVNYALGGAAVAVSAHSAVTGIEHTLHAGAELQKERVALRNAGRTAEEIKAMEDASHATLSAVPTSSLVENLKVLNETTSAFGSIEHAMEHLTFMQKTAAVLHSTAGDKIQAGPAEMGQLFAKFFEMRGVAGDAHRFEHEGNEMTRAMVFTGGRFNPQEMYGFAQQAKSALQNYDLPFLSKIIPSLITENGGQRAGTAANAFSNVILGKANDKRQAEAWLKYGLIDPKQMIMKSGTPVAWSGGAVHHTDLALSNPLRYGEEVLLPALQKGGVDINNRLELTKVLGTLFRNQMSNMFANELWQAQNRARLHKDATLTDKVDTPDSIYDRNLKEDPFTAMNALKNSLDSLASSVSSPAMQGAAKTITGIAVGIGSLAGALDKHPNIAMAAGAGTAAAAVGGAGYASYQLMNGFGLGASATALDGSAAALTGAAEALTAAAAGKGVLAAGAGGAAAAAAEGGALATAFAVALPLAVASALTAYMAAHGFGTYDPKKFEDTEENRRKTQNIGALPGLDGEDAPEPPTPIRPLTEGAPKPSWWQRLKRSVFGAPADTPSPFGGLDSARATFAPHPALVAPHPSFAPISPLANGLPTLAGGASTSPIEAKVTGPVTAELKGQAAISVTVKAINAEVVNQTSTSSGNIKVSTGGSMPTAKAATGSSPAP